MHVSVLSQQSLNFESLIRTMGFMVKSILQGLGQKASVLHRRRMILLSSRKLSVRSRNCTDEVDVFQSASNVYLYTRLNQGGYGRIYFEVHKVASEHPCASVAVTSFYMTKQPVIS